MDVQRRTVLQAGGLVAVGGLVAACGGGATSESSSAPAGPTSAPTTSGPGASSSPSAGPNAAGGVVSVSDVPVGGGVILPDEAVVITQPSAGDVKVFTAICTHQGCLVSQVVDNEIMCPCHGSRFSGNDGSVIQGPATQPLAAEAFAVDGGQVVLTG